MRDKTMKIKCKAAVTIDDNGGTKTFRFKLTHSGANRNDDFISDDELKAAAATAIGGKVDFQHSPMIRDIVGQIASADYAPASGEEPSYVDCAGDLWADEFEPSRLAYKLLKTGIVKNVSYELDADEAECSVCGAKFKVMADACTHIANYWQKKPFKGKAVQRILHGVRFTGVGLLDFPGADPAAEVTAVAAPLTNYEEDEEMKNQGSAEADDKKKVTAQAAAEGASGTQAETQTQTETPTGEPPAQTETQTQTDPPAADMSAQAAPGDTAPPAETPSATLLEANMRITQLETELAAYKAKERELDAKRLIAEMKRRGFGFADASAEQKQLDDFKAMSDEAYAAAATAYMSMPIRSGYYASENDPKGVTAQGAPDADLDKTWLAQMVAKIDAAEAAHNAYFEKKTAAEKEKKIAANAGVEPFPVADKIGDKSPEEKLVEKLGKVVNAAYDAAKNRNPQV